VNELDQEKIVYLKYSENKFEVNYLSEETEEKTYGSVSVGYTDTVKRSSERQPYITFRLELASTNRVTVIQQEGEEPFIILLDAISLVGGFFTSLGAVALGLVTYLTKASFVQYITGNLFLTKNEPATSDMLYKRSVTKKHKTAFERLKAGTQQGMVDETDIKNMVDILRYERKPLSTLNRSILFKIYEILRPCCRCLCTKRGTTQL
jgi:hypothetical protein